MSTSFNRWTCKWLTGFCGIGLMLRIYKHQHHTKCPPCNTDDKTTTHVLCCPHTTATQLWHEEMTKLTTWIQDNKGSDDLAAAIVSYLNSWHHNSPVLDTSALPQTLQDALRQQAEIGWEYFIEGFWSLEWRTYLQEYFDSIRSKQSSILWCSRLQRKIWLIAWALWKQRNDMLHTHGQTIHQYDSSLLNDEIRDEWNTARNLPQQYHHLFQGTLEAQLEGSIHHKRQWLTSI